MPEIGVFWEPTLDGEFTRRMSGLAHPNTLGQYAGLTVVVGVALFQFYGQRSKWRMLVIILAAAALVSSLSRTSLVATVLGLITPRK
jgi:O-antigen ligase